MKFKLLMILTVMLGLSACQEAADVASKNLSKAADNFEIDRRIVFYNGITGDYILEITGKCSLGNFDSAGQLTVTCKTDDEVFKKHFLGLSDNVTFFAEQITSVGVSTYHNRVTFRPQAIIPDIDYQGSMDELTTNKNTDG